MARKQITPYERGKRWGFAIFKSNLELFGKRGLDKSDAAARTCGRYARDMSIKKTKSGKFPDFILIHLIFLEVILKFRKMRCRMVIGEQSLS